MDQSKLTDLDRSVLKRLKAMEDRPYDQGAQMLLGSLTMKCTGLEKRLAMLTERLTALEATVKQRLQQEDAHP